MNYTHSGPDFLIPTGEETSFGMGAESKTARSKVSVEFSSAFRHTPKKVI